MLLPGQISSPGQLFKASISHKESKSLPIDQGAPLPVPVPAAALT